MLTLQSSLYALVLAICTLCVFIAKNSKGRRHYYLIIFMVLESFSFIFEWLMLHPSTPGKALWLGLFMWTLLLISPCVWLFAKEITEDKTPRLNSLSTKHYIVIVIAVLLTLPLIQTTHWGVDYGNPDNIASKRHSLIIHASMLLCIFIFLCQAFYYLKQCVGVFVRHTQNVKALFSTIESKSFNALRLLIFILCAHWLVSLLRTLHCFFIGKDTGLGIFFVLIEVIVTLWVLLKVIHQTTTFSFEDRQFIKETTIESLPEQTRYARSALDEVTRERVVQKINHALESQKLYRNNMLSLRDLCDATKENPHYVSQVINQYFGTNFYDLINRYRVEYAKQLLLSEPNRSIIDIALDAGFNSKSTFNAAFKRHFHTTPSSYRQTSSST